MRILLFAAATGLLLPMAAHAAKPAHCANIDQAHVAALFETWNDTLRTGTPAKVAALYADDAVLLPTLSNTPRYTTAARIDYFKHFMARHPVGHVDERRIALGCNMVLDSGLYTFFFDDGTHVAARFSFAYVFDGARWRIASHHSSAMPEGDDAHEAHDAD